MHRFGCTIAPSPKHGCGPSDDGARTESAFARAVKLCSVLAPNDFPHGAVLFCSIEVSEVFHPTQPILRQTVICKRSFDTSTVREALTLRRKFTYAIAVVDGDEATLGTLLLPSTGPCRGLRVAKVAHVTANIASRTRRGGQSAARFSRNRDLEELAYLRKVAEIMREVFGDLSVIVIGGRADLKRKLISELPSVMQNRVERIVDLQCHANQAGLQEMVKHAQDVAFLIAEREKDGAVQNFLELMARTTGHEAPLICYGEMHTMAALQMGLVRELLVASNPYGKSVEGYDRWHKLATAAGANLVELSPRSELQSQFCDGFGVGACLRYAISPEMLEDRVLHGESHSRLPYGSLNIGSENLVKSPLGEPDKVGGMEETSDGDGRSTAPSEADNALRNWLNEALALALQDTAAAESLATGSELVIFDDTLAIEERVEAVTEMLRGEGVPEEVLIELAMHIFDHFGDEI